MKTRTIIAIVAVIATQPSFADDQSVDRVVVRYEGPQLWNGLRSDGFDISSDGRLIAMPMRGREGVGIWNTSTGAFVCQLDRAISRKVGAACLFFKDDKRIATYARQGRLTIWRVADGKPLSRIMIAPYEYHVRRQLTVAKRGGTVAIVNKMKRTIDVVDLDSGQLVSAVGFPKSIEEIEEIAFDSSGSFVVAIAKVEFKHVLFRFRLKDSKIVGRWALLDELVQGAVLSPHGTYCAVNGESFAEGEGNCYVRLIDMSTGREVHRLPMRLDTRISMAFSADESTLAVRNRTGDSIDLLAVESGRQTKSLHGVFHKVWSIRFASDGSTVGAVTSFGVRLWNTKTGKQFPTTDGIGIRVRLSMDSQGGVLASDSLRGVEVWNNDSKQILWRRPRSRCPIVSRDGDRIYMMTGRDIACHEIRTGDVIWTRSVSDQDFNVGTRRYSVEDRLGEVGPLVVSACETQFAVRTSEKMILVYDRDSDSVQRVKLSPNTRFGGIPVFSQGDKSQLSVPVHARGGLGLRIWNRKGGKFIPSVVDPLAHDETSGLAAAISANGRNCVVLGSDKYGDESAFIFQLEPRKLISTIHLKERRVAFGVTPEWQWPDVIAISSQGAHVAIATNDNSVYLFDGTNGKNTARLRHRHSCSCVSFSSNGRLLACSYTDGSIVVWRVGPTEREDTQM